MNLGFLVHRCILVGLLLRLQPPEWTAVGIPEGSLLPKNAVQFLRNKCCYQRSKRWSSKMGVFRAVRQ